MHKDLEKYAGMALQGIMGNPTYLNYTKERMVEDVIQVAEVLCTRLDQLKEAHLVVIKSQVDMLPKTKSGIPIFTDLALFRSAEEMKIKECVISGFLRNVSFGYITIVFPNDDKFMINQLSGLHIKETDCDPTKHVWLHMKYEFGDWSINAVKEVEEDL